MPSFTADDILKTVKSRRYVPEKADALATRLGVKKNELDPFLELLDELLFEGLLVEEKKRRLCLPENTDLVVGTLDVTRRDIGFVIPKGGEDLEDLFVPPEDRGTAMHRDTVVVQLSKQNRGGNNRGPRGKVVRVIRRANQILVGTFCRDKGRCWIEVDNPRISERIYIDSEDAFEAEAGKRVVVKVDDWSSSAIVKTGQVVEILGDPNDPATDALAVIRQYSLPDRFDKKTKAEAKAFGEAISQEAIENRTDLRDQTIVTIDPKEAHDFDDAISLEHDNDIWRLGVHIADVSHYVKPGTALDKEAISRSTSVYLPGHVLPMLPTELSSHLCSLREGEDRLTKSVFMTFDSEGALQDYRIAHTVIRSTKRLTYQQVTKILNGKNQESEEVTNLLRNMNSLAKLLLKQRMDRGALDMEMPEIDVEVRKDGTTKEVRKRVREFSHRIIEEFMLSANTAVAEICRRHNLPCMFRVHDKPSEVKLDEFRQFLLAWGYTIPVEPDRRDLQKFLATLGEKTEAYPIQIALLRSLKRAEYTPENLGHYALAIERYCHFTSPIRRYPDLLVHRTLDEFLDGKLRTKKETSSWRDHLERLAKHCSHAERKADEAERELRLLKLLRFLKEHSNEPLTGIIVSMRHNALFVELEDTLVQGLLPINAFEDDYYEFNQRAQAFHGRSTGRTLRLGERIQVMIEEVDMPSRHVYFRPDGMKSSSKSKKENKAEKVEPVWLKYKERSKQKGKKKAARSKPGKGKRGKGKDKGKPKSRR
jgi:ribonuclease R